MDRQWEAVKVLIVGTFALALSVTGGLLAVARTGRIVALDIYWAMGLCFAFGLFLATMLLYINREEGADGETQHCAGPAGVGEDDVG